MPMKHVKMAPAMIDMLIDDDISVEISKSLPSAQQAETAVLAACVCAEFAVTEIDVCIRFASDTSQQALNKQWRDQDKVTDVLSFPMQQAPCDASEPLGDIALAVPFILQEAARLDVPEHDHCLHLIIHATLHLLSFDHIDDHDAKRMQALEQQAMQALGLHNPYPEAIDNKQTDNKKTETEQMGNEEVEQS